MKILRWLLAAACFVAFGAGAAARPHLEEFGQAERCAYKALLFAAVATQYNRGLRSPDQIVLMWGQDPTEEEMVMVKDYVVEAFELIAVIKAKNQTAGRPDGPLNELEIRDRTKLYCDAQEPVEQPGLRKMSQSESWTEKDHALKSWCKLKQYDASLLLKYVSDGMSAGEFGNRAEFAAAEGSITPERRDSVLRLVESFNAKTVSAAQWEIDIHQDCLAIK